MDSGNTIARQYANQRHGNPAAVGYDKSGGWSYGRYQITTSSASNPSGYGTMATFMENLKEYDIDSYNILIAAGGLEGAKAGTQEFKDAWASITNSPNFVDAERAFIYDTHYVLVLDTISKYDPNIGNRSIEVQQAIWGQSVQLGVPLNKIFFSQFSKTTDIASLTDIELTQALYAYKISTVDTYFKSSTPEIRDAIRTRYENELSSILKDLGG